MTELPVLGPFAPLPLPAVAPVEEAAAEAETILASARAEAARITADASNRGDALVAEAEGHLKEARARADSANKKAQRWSRDIDTWSARVVIGAAVGLTASGEYQLARKVHFIAEVAWLLPVAIDVYVIQAFRRHRDIAPAIGLTIAANVIYHLSDAGLFGVKTGGAPEWWLIAIVASIASLILWRMHRMMAPAEHRQKRGWWRSASPSESQANIVLTPAESEAKDAAPGGGDRRQKRTPSGPIPTVSKTPTRGRRRAVKVRRSLTEWVAVTGPIFHAEFNRLKRQPTADEFATAIERAGLGKVGTTTAKNIRAEILDRTDVPALTD